MMKTRMLVSLVATVLLLVACTPDEAVTVTRPAGDVTLSPSAVSPHPTTTATPTVTPLPETAVPSSPTPAPTPPPSATPSLLQDTLTLYTTIEDGNWALRAYPSRFALTEDVFDRFYGPVAPMDDVRRYTQFNFGPQLSPNGRYLLLPGVGGYGGAETTGLWFVNLQTNDVRQLLPRAKAFTWSPYGDQITYVDGETLYTLSVAEGAEPQPLFSHPDLWELYARWSPDGSYIATMTTTQDEPVGTGSPQSTDTYWLVPVHGQSPYQLAQRPGSAIEHVAEEMTWSPTGRHLLVRNEVFDLEGQQLSPSLAGRAHWLPLWRTLQADEEERLLLNGRDGLRIVTIGGEEVVRITDSFVNTWAFSHDGRFLAYLEPLTDSDLTIFDLTSLEIVRTNRVPVKVQSMHWSGDNDHLLLDDGDRGSPIWAFPRQPPGRTQVLLPEGTLLTAFPAPVTEVAPGTALPAPPSPSPAASPRPETRSLAPGLPVFFARDDDLWRASASGERVERLTEGGALHWGMRQGGDEWRIAALSAPPQVSPDGRWLAFFPDGRMISLVPVTAARQARRIDASTGIAAWSPDSRYLAYGANGSLFVYDLAHDYLHPLLSGVSGVANVVWSPNGQEIAFACCFLRPRPYGPADFGDIRRMALATGRVEIVDATTRTVGGGIPSLCWTDNGQVVKWRGVGPGKTEHCSYQRAGVSDLSPDATRIVSLERASPDADFGKGDTLLKVRRAQTDEILWQYRLNGTAVRPRWALDGARVLVQRGSPVEDNLAIWRMPVDGTAEPELALDDAYLLDVIPQWAK